MEHGPQGLEAVPYRFTGKELDQETGLYYYGARYLNPRTSRWISADPALESYLPEAPVSDRARKRNQSLPGQGGILNLINLVMYHYGANNPVKYTDPSGSANVLAWIILSPGHGPNGTGYKQGTSGRYQEVDFVYNLTKRLIPMLESKGFGVYNLKADPYKAYWYYDKVSASDSIYNKKGSNVLLHVAVHADANRTPADYTGVDIYYIAGAPISKKIADFFAAELRNGSFEVRVRPDTLAQGGRLSELRDTDAPAVYFEIGAIDIPGGRALLNDSSYMDRLSRAITDAIDKFFSEKPNQ